MRKTNAIPTIVEAKGVFVPDDVKNDIREVTPASGVSLSSVINKSLQYSAAALSIAVLVEGGKVCAANADLKAALASDAAYKVYTLRPVAGQEGRSLRFEKEASTNGYDAGTVTLLDGMVAAVRPSYNVASLVQQIASQIPDVAGKRHAIFVDQAAGKVHVVEYADDGLDVDLIDVVVASAHGFHAEMVLPVVTAGGGAPAALKFEGGAV